MADRLDDAARILAAEGTIPRRKALRGLAALFGGGVVGAVAGRTPAGAAPPVKCQAGTTLCGTVCRDTAINPDHCGACGNACPAGQMCRNGACVPCICEPACASGQVRCNGQCVNLGSDPSHCGACGHTCPPGQSCFNGVCSVCPPQNMCNGGCADLQNDANNCGTCGHVCSAVNATSTCVAGQCVHSVCDPGFADCDPTIAGCETSLSSVTSCGGCGIVCPTGASCVNGSCVCPSGTEVCGGACTASIGQACNTGLGGNCAAGTIQCVDNRTVCVAPAGC